MTLMQVIERMTLGPAALYGFEADSIEEGKRADVIVFNPEESFRYEKSLSKSQNSPFLGQTLYGKLYATIIEGEVVYRREEN